MSKDNQSQFKKEGYVRLFWGSISTLIASVIIAFSFWPCGMIPFVLSLCVIGWIGGSEFFRLVQAKGISSHPNLGRSAIVGFLLLHYLMMLFPHISSGMIWGILLLFICLALSLYLSPQSNPLVNIATMLMGVLYVALPLILMTEIAAMTSETSCRGGIWLAYLLLVTKIADVGAYFVGKKWGKRPLAPRLSPKKTQEGAIAGLLFSVLASVIFAIVTQEVSITTGMVLGAIVAILGTIGDLGESALKRDAQIKDSNNLPGLGGVLDLLDSLVFSTPVIYIFLLFKMQI